MAYERGDVVLVAFPFSEAPGTKVRPAVVLNTSEYEREMGMLVVALITGRQRGGRFEIQLDAWREAGLLKPSVVRAKYSTVDVNLVRRRTGTIDRESLRLLDICISRTFGIKRGGGA